MQVVEFSLLNGKILLKQYKQKFGFKLVKSGDESSLCSAVKRNSAVADPKFATLVSAIVLQPLIVCLRRLSIWLKRCICSRLIRGFSAECSVRCRKFLLGEMFCLSQ